ncbi:hypothetical protein Ae168Ps1_1832 [Pseudonocardia sp. Ae168_Ps1]|uniref:hypothetical protein n=1 Tax=unclassified Pseudonocardia TaxID=2619320 RepID=UPI00094B1833|nr:MULTISPECIES: hypothetical protein [unclassified Pseudonocardia]OLL73449.1 hypothetical protein Ae150APs1_1827 [Pseudonocardia sp. Ae150A_Ps1]OLL79426.1 hypothetical protein Ae168Ps1_1832 [Pseudonocardia sp. Ae168_Ps1]OLL86440.1 hypothetical protein Ae263Ps1_3495c [Pseudonocardia sp. Ae263_Ps1]OLL93519.1 hypothetical protein Ae356Ps1_3416 [Pseudonocardia sp. Ae356_Ps1]
MYEPQTILDAIDDNTLPVMLGFAAAMVLQNIAMVTAVVMTRREGWISIPLPCTFLWFAHDLGVVVRVETWFVTYDHWFLKLFWVGLLTAFLLELVFLAQAVRVGRREYLPDGTRAQWTALVVGGVTAIVVLWEWQKVVWDDPLYQAAPAMTLFLLPIAATALILRRRSAVSQSVVVYGCFAGMVPLWWGITALYYRGPFLSWQYLAAGVLAFAMLVAATVLVERMRAAGATAAPDPAPAIAGR